jgi:L-asparaginase/beta-aspartyl-peptidase (threonine type)
MVNRGSKRLVPSTEVADTRLVATLTAVGPEIEPMHVIAHGGAGSTPDEPAKRQQTLATAAEEATRYEDPLDAACAAVRALEDDPRFNAGVGSVAQSDGVIRTDAGLMVDDGTTGDGTVGAACGMPGVTNAVDVARVVATETPHVVLAGEPAVNLAAAFDVETGVDLWTERTRERWDAADPPSGGLRESLPWVREQFGQGSDTVGAVATDGETLVAATSTGGRWFALAGRVGDVPQVGAGFYADDRGGASATGAGEAIARFGLARRAVDELDRRSSHQAAEEDIEGFAEATGERAGLVVVDHDGHAGSATNAASMQTAERP